MLSGSFLFPGLIYSIHLQPGADPSLLPPTKVISGLRIDEEKKERLSGVSLIFFSLYVVPFKEILCFALIKLSSSAAAKKGWLTPVLRSRSRLEPRFFSGSGADLKFELEPEPIFWVGFGSFFWQVKNEII